MKFGSPKAGDSTAEREKWIREAAEARVERLNELDRVLNRPIGSVVDVPVEDRILEYQMRLADPMQWSAEIEQRAQVIGLPRAMHEALVYDRDSQALMKEHG